jgi:hypothetical protein
MGLEPILFHNFAVHLPILSKGEGNFDAFKVPILLIIIFYEKKIFTRFDRTGMYVWNERMGAE